MNNRRYIIENFKDLSEYCTRLKSYYKINNLLIWNYKNAWWLMCDHKYNVVGDMDPSLILKLKKLNKIIPELSDEEFKVQLALGTLEDKFFTLYD